MNRYNLEEKLIGEGSFGVSKLILEEALDWINVVGAGILTINCITLATYSFSSYEKRKFGSKSKRERERERERERWLSVIWK